MSEIKWSQISAQQLEQLHRAISHQVRGFILIIVQDNSPLTNFYYYYYKYPLSTKFNNKVIQLHNISLPPVSQHSLIQPSKSLEPGTIIVHHPKQLLPTVYVVCADNNVITFDSVKVERKKEVSTLDWINGYQVKSEKTKFEE